MQLERFKIAQDDRHAGFATALAELEAGRKTSHWIWYIFPQLSQLGRSSTAQFYGLADLPEAEAYARDALLCEHLLAASNAVAAQGKRGQLLSDVMGGETDMLKLVSSLTLFEGVAHRLAAAAGAGPEIKALAEVCGAVLTLAEKQGIARCSVTLQASANAR